MPRALRSFVPAALLFLLIATVYYLYSPAFGARFSFDDIPNLQTLNRLDLGDSAQVFEFIFNIARNGGIGRPLAFASFVLQAPYWPADPGAFLYVNILIHLLNGMLVAWLAVRLHRLVPSLLGVSVNGFAISLAAVWLLQPLSATASMMLVQRMTTLAATFMLAGIIVYLVGRERLGRGDARGWWLMIGGAALGTGLAVLTKEIGALLPLYLWALEITLLRDQKPSRWLLPWRLALALPGVLLVLYAVSHWDVLARTMDNRSFTINERLLSEFRVLAQYVLLTFFPIRNQLGAFHDDYPISHGLLDPPTTLFCLLGWLALTAFAVIGRKRFPLPAFAIFWFLLGHSLESTVFNLELYFEHRNYLPCLGPLILLCASLWRLPDETRRLGLVVFVLYLGLEGFVLREVATVWGAPRLAAEIWVAEHPNSERVWQNLALQHALLGDEPKALTITREGFKQNPQSIALGLQVLQLECYQGKDISADIPKILPLLSNGERSFSAPDAVKKLVDKLDDKPCQGLQADSLNRMIDFLLTNKKYLADPVALSALYRVRAQLYLKDRAFDPLIRNLENAFVAQPDIDTAMLMVGYLVSGGLYDAALEKIAFIRSRTPFGPVAKYEWGRRLDDAESDLKLMKSNARQPPEK